MFVIFISMGLIFVVNFGLYSRRALPQPTFSIKFSDQLNSIGIFFLLANLLTFGFFTYFYYEDLSWYLAQEESLPAGLMVFLTYFKCSVGICIFLYALSQKSMSNHYKLFRLFFALFLILFAITSTKLGNRTDVIALLSGILFFQLSIKKLDARSLAGVLVLVLLAIVAASTIEFYRYENDYNVSEFQRRIIVNDYFAPAHVLFAAVAYDLQNPSEVFYSNFYNSLMFFDYPFLQKYITDYFYPGLTTRSASFALYIFAEGYLFAGYFAPIYNAAVITVMIYLWNLIPCTDNEKFNLILRSVLAAMVINLTRGQSSYFIKYIYLYFIPVFLILSITLGARFKFLRKTA
jgi:hypothetical protein